MSDAPALRAVEAFPLTHDGHQFVGLRDPAGFTPSVLMLPREAVEIVALLDGRNSVIDIQAELMRRHGELVPRADIDAIVATLDEHGFLDSPRFAARRRKIEREFLSAPARPASHAGGAYAAEPESLRSTMDGYFAPPAGPGPIDRRSRPAGTVKALIAPHIDFHRGGPAYAWGYHDLALGADADLFVIFGTCHAGMRHPFALTRKDYDTPLGPAPVDREMVEAVGRRARQDCFAAEIAHRAEHSIEFQAVFLRYLYAGRRDFSIVPVLTSFAHEALARGRRPEDDPRVLHFLDALRDALASSGRRVAFVAGADLAHVGPRFGDGEPVSDAQLETIGGEDRAMLKTVERGDAGAFFESVACDGDRRRICGLSPIWALLSSLEGAAGTVRHYGQWPDPQGVVTFASVVF